MTTSHQRTYRVAIVGAGPAGIYAADTLSKSEFDVSIDLFEKLPAPYGLVRYGVAPDHPRIKGIMNALHRVLDRGEIRLLANVEFGTDITLDDMRNLYDAVIFSTGSIRDAQMNIPGRDLEGSFGAADFVSWYDGHPDYPLTWPLEAEKIAVIGNGNVALDVARMLSKHPEDLLSTEIPDNVYQGLKASPVTDVHIFGRRGPAQAKFTPLELREMGQMNDVDVIVYPEDFQFDEASQEAMESSNQVKQVVQTLMDWALIDPSTRSASRRVHLHFFHAPVEILGTDGRVSGLRTDRTELMGDGSVDAMEDYTDWPVQAVYRAVGYFGSPLTDVPFDDERGVIPNAGGRVHDVHGEPVPGLYTTGWIKRGPVGLIGHTKSDASETVRHLVEDLPDLPAPAEPNPQAVLDLLAEREVRVVNWQAWQLLDEHEKQLGEAQERERIKVVPRDEMLDIQLGG